MTYTHGNTKVLQGNTPEDFMCQDLCRGLTIWFSTRLGATAHLRPSAPLTPGYGVPREPNPIPPNHEQTVRQSPQG